jgi:hypothetical protein
MLIDIQSAQIESQCVLVKQRKQAEDDKVHKKACDDYRSADQRRKLPKTRTGSTLMRFYANKVTQMIRRRLTATRLRIAQDCLCPLVGSVFGIWGFIAMSWSGGGA